jgi:hypothetical protein
VTRGLRATTPLQGHQNIGNSISTVLDAALTGRVKVLEVGLLAAAAHNSRLFFEFS